MLDLLEIKDWLKTKTDVGDGIAVGAIKGEKLRYIGVYDGKNAARQRVCLGGWDRQDTRSGRSPSWSTGPKTPVRPQPRPRKSTVCSVGSPRNL